MDQNFRVGHSSNPDWSGAIKECLEQVGNTDGFTLGFLYVVEPLGQALNSILDKLRSETAITDWTGASAIGILANDVEYFERHAVAIMVAQLPKNSFETFEEQLPLHKNFAVAHCDSRRPDIDRHIIELTNTQNCFLVGGLTMPEGYRINNRAVPDWRTTGVAFSEDVHVQTGVTQGCTPIGPIHVITRCRDNVAFMIDDQPALQVFKNEIGPVLSKRLENAAGYIFAAKPIPSSDTGDYLVRNIVGVDPERNLLAIAAAIQPGDQILFCKRDDASAKTDLANMTQNVVKRLTGPARGALYYSCVARGPNLFGEESQEIRTIQSALDPDGRGIPLIGFFANGEISNDRLYTYTGVLAVFS